MDRLQSWQISNMFDIYTDHNRPKQTQVNYPDSTFFGNRSSKTLNQEPWLYDRTGHKMSKIQFPVPEKSQSGAGFTIYRRNGTALLIEICVNISHMEKTVKDQ